MGRYIGGASPNTSSDVAVRDAHEIEVEPVAKPLAKATQQPVKTAATEPIEPEYNEWRVLPIATLTSIATVIGSGILALPVTLYDTQVPVFIVLFTISMLAQVGVVYAMVELLQRARVDGKKRELSSAAQSADYEAIGTATSKEEVSLFDIADLYLHNPIMRFIYLATTFFCLISILVSYGLAGPQAVWQLFTPGAQPSPPPAIMNITYWTLGTGAVIFFVDQLLGFFGSLTVVKGALFIGVVIIVGMLPEQARVENFDSLMSNWGGWGNAAAPFLMSCVALGGLANTTPVTFNLLPTNATRGQVSRYRTAIIISVILCYLLNVGWVLAVLQVVPRSAPEGEASLTVAYELGQISTVPLIDVLHHGKAVEGFVLGIIEVIVEMFIFVSTGVSFFVVSAAMKSFVDGATSNVYRVAPVLRHPYIAWFPKTLSYAVSFGPVLYVIIVNPSGFIEVLTRFTSFTLNLQAGAFLFIMAYNSRKMTGVDRFLASLQGINYNDGSPDGAEATKKAVLIDLEGQEANEHDESIPLSMAPRVAGMWIYFGTWFFLSACALAALGPMLGIKLGGRE